MQSIIKRSVRLYTSQASSSNYQYIISNVHADKKIGVIQLNRPKQLNALCDGLMREVDQALKSFDKDDNVHAAILTGSDRAFAAGADIKEMADTNLPRNYKSNFLAHWSNVTQFRKPLIAAVSGFALGGGCELAMMCDIIVASDSAIFSQPEIKLGTIPGAGGTQRLCQSVGKSNAMWLVLSGQNMTAQEALQRNLVTAVFPQADLMKEATKMAEKIAQQSVPILMMAKEAVNYSYDVAGLQQGLQYERRLFQSTFGFKDRAEGMKAFVEKRKPNFTHE
ncbi:hypothetical protein MP228_011793 [Amoeboaphelidium protococcarum]|nr:hypothetical protein MP228_011793 [Amoeboaphelidium protococcarum]